MSDYHKLSILEKRALNISTVRESAITCAVCDTQLMPVDLEKHMSRCQGPREPGPGTQWVTWREAIRLVPKRTLNRWVKRGHVRTDGAGRGDRKYSLRDLVVHRQALRLLRRR